MPASARSVLLLSCLLALSGCDLLGVETASQVAAKKEAEGKAVGSACRHAVRSIEDCFRTNPKAMKSAVFAGWREMDQYMRENNVVGMPFDGATSPPEVPHSPAAKPGAKGEPEKTKG